MPRYIALLRAINVGGHTVKMADLRLLFEELGFTAVETYIASGNVIFETEQAFDGLQIAIETHLKAKLGYAVATFLRTPSEMGAVANYQAFSAEDLKNASFYVAFLNKEPHPAAIEKLFQFPTSIDLFHIHGSECYWLCRTKISDSKFSGATLEKLLGMPATIRNITTVQKLAALYPPDPE